MCSIHEIFSDDVISILSLILSYSVITYMSKIFFLQRWRVKAYLIVLYLEYWLIIFSAAGLITRFIVYHLR